MRRIILTLACLLTLATAMGQTPRMNTNGMASSSGQKGGLRSGARSDSLSSNKDKEIPKGVKVWQVDEVFGDIRPALRDTAMHMFQNTIFTEGMHGEYNATGNLGAPRLNRIVSLRNDAEDTFIFMQPYDYFSRRPSEFLFTNTLSPITNLSYNFCGNRMNGEDHFSADFATNVNKRLGLGFKLNYLYGRGYYNEQSTSLFNFNLYGSYLGQRYQAHVIATTNAQKIFENGGLSDDMYITHPESFDDNYAPSEMPTVLSNNWNRNSNQHLFLTHRYSVGFSRKVPMTDEEIAAKKFAMESEKENSRLKALEERRKRGEDVDDDDLQDDTTYGGRPDEATIQQGDEPEQTAAIGNRLSLDVDTADSLAHATPPAEEQWMKDEYVPVTSFIHTLRLDNYKRIYQAHTSPRGFYANDFYTPDVIGGDSIYDLTRHFRLRNTFAMSMLEGFNHWMLAGIKVFAASDLRHYALPDADGRLASHNDHNLSIGAQLSKQQGNTLHYNATAQTCVLGDEIGQVKIDGQADLNFPLLGDTVRLAASGFFHRTKPSYFLRHYHGRHFLWDEDLPMTTHTRLQGLFAYEKTRTTLRAAVDALTDYSYLAATYERSTTNASAITDYDLHLRRSSSPISVLTLELQQDLTFGPLNWESTVTYQQSTAQSQLPVPKLNIYTNLYLKFRIARVLHTELGADLRYFTKYNAPEYAPAVGKYAVQENATKTALGNYPIVNAYANFCLKGTRFFVLYSRAYSSPGNAFLAPHYPLNPSTLHIGISWDFYN